jgi:uncharacterized protein
MKTRLQILVRVIGLVVLAGLFVVPAHGDTVKEKDKFKFEKRKIQVGGKSIMAEIADDSDLREHGLMFREKLADNTGMLFIFETEQPLNFWMKNTLIPLSIGFFGKNKKLIDIQEMVPAVMGDQDPQHYPSSGPALYALEMPKGWFARNKISRGATLNPGPSSNQHD